ncbi:hypothetical protein ANN_16077 [Periplaneta americana]|uniref:Uncharacterized protein n=1 Tax=Periplaneta americana TaxID=6978 RepID=A0ABQ8SHZ4_PERAM|nr:hypothetical protein ANN_16077 [Periplaneta americana]
MAGLCEGGNEPSGSLKAICKLFSVDAICESGKIFGEMRTRIRHRLPDIRFTVRKIWKKNSTRLLSVDGIGDSKMVSGETRPRIRHKLPDIRLTPSLQRNLGRAVEIRLNKKAFIPTFNSNIRKELRNYEMPIKSDFVIMGVSVYG